MSLWAKVFMREKKLLDNLKDGGFRHIDKNNDLSLADFSADK